MRIKIGESSDYRKRIQQHQDQKFGIASHDFKLLCVVRGDGADEKAVHRYFENERIEGRKEEFWASDRLVEYIHWLRDNHFVYCPDCIHAPKKRNGSDDDESTLELQWNPTKKEPCTCPTIEEIDLVDQSLWMPNASRRKAAPSGDMFSAGKLDPADLPPRVVTIDDFYTSSIILDAAREAMGGIDLDPASHAWANSKVKAARFFSIRDDGLASEWAGRVWLNPPFSTYDRWGPKLVEEWRSGRLAAACALIDTRRLTAKYLKSVKDECRAFCVLHGRIPFWGDRAADPNDGHAIFYFGGEPGRFKNAFTPIGNVFWNSATEQPA